MSDVTVAHIRWRRSRRSTEHGTNCVEVAAGAGVLARDSKDPGGAVLAFTSAEWAAFVGAVKRGAFDLG